MAILCWPGIRVDVVLLKWALYFKDDAGPLGWQKAVAWKQKREYRHGYVKQLH